MTTSGGHPAADPRGRVLINYRINCERWRSSLARRGEGRAGTISTAAYAKSDYPGDVSVIERAPRAARPACDLNGTEDHRYSI